jgi:hypothetical protein
MYKNRRFFLSIQVLSSSKDLCKCSIHLPNEVQQNIRTLGHVKVGPADTLDLNDRSRFRLWVIVISYSEYSLNVRCWSALRLRGGSGHSKVETGRGLVAFILPARLGDLVDSHWAILLSFPVVAAFDRTSFELLCNPAISNRQT